MAVAGGWADRHPDPRRSASFHARSLIQPNHRDKRANPNVVPTPRDRYHGSAVTPDTAPGARVSHRWRLVATALGVAMDRRQQAAAAAERYHEMARDREELKRRQEAEGTRVVDTPERVRARAARLAQAGQLQPEALVKAIAPTRQLAPHVVLERIIDATNDLQGVNFLPRGGRAARTVARISYERRGRLVPAGTGALVGQRLLLTNNHVLPDAATAQQAVAEFNCEIDLDEHPVMIAAYRLDPDTLFLTHEHLDHPLVGGQAGSDGRRRGGGRG